MALFDFNKKNKETLKSVKQEFQTLNMYAPVYSSFKGSLYELSLVRSSIHTLATHTSKLNPIVNSDEPNNFERIISVKPNPFMTTSQFLYQLRTIYEIENTAFIIPEYNKFGEMIAIYPISSIGSQIKEIDGIFYLIYNFNNKLNAIEFDRTCILRKMQYSNKIYGENNNPLRQTAEMLHAQNEAISSSAKKAGTISFIGRLSQVLKKSDQEQKQKDFYDQNLSVNNTSGIVVVDKVFEDIKQIDYKPYIISNVQSQAIEQNVINYYNVPLEIIQNKADENTWSSFYEGAIETFALQLSQGLTNLFFADKKIIAGNEIIFTSNRLQFANTTTKLNVVSQLTDRGIMTFNQALEIFNMPHVEDGDKRIIRGEYLNVEALDEHTKSKVSINSEVKEE